MTAPGYWKHETSGVLRPVVERYLHGETLDVAEVLTMRAYLRQWIAAPGFVGAEVEALRASVDTIVDMPSLHRWLELALDAGVDPL